MPTSHDHIHCETKHLNNIVLESTVVNQGFIYWGVQGGVFPPKSKQVYFLLPVCAVHTLAKKLMMCTSFLAPINPKVVQKTCLYKVPTKCLSVVN